MGSAIRCLNYFLFVIILSVTQVVHAQDLNLEDLGYKSIQTDLDTQKTLETRRYMLEQHQLWGIVAIIGLAAAFSAAKEGELAPEHALFAGMTVASYGASTYYGLKAPTLAGKKKGQTEWHKYLAWIHLPAMILTPIAGVEAAKDHRNGKPLGSLAKQHKNLAGVAAASLGLSVALVSFEF